MSWIKRGLKNSKLINTIYWNYIYCPAVLQMDLSEIEPLSDEYKGYRVKELATDSPLFDEYLEFINVMYGEKLYQKEELIHLLTNHYWLKDVKTYILTDNSDQIVATCSTGVYRDNQDWGGVFKFATDKSLRNRGLGFFMLSYGYGKLKEKGCHNGESIVSFKNSRIPSLMTHFKCGFKPQTDRKKVKYSLVNKRGGIKHLFTRRWVKKYYGMYLDRYQLR